MTLVLFLTNALSAKIIIHLLSVILTVRNAKEIIDVGSVKKTSNWMSLEVAFHFTNSKVHKIRAFSSKNRNKLYPSKAANSVLLTALSVTKVTNI